MSQRDPWAPIANQIWGLPADQQRAAVESHVNECDLSDADKRQFYASIRRHRPGGEPDIAPLSYAEVEARGGGPEHSCILD